MGYTFSSAMIRKSMTTGRSSISLALVMASSISSGSSTRMASQPMDCAHIL